MDVTGRVTNRLTARLTAKRLRSFLWGGALWDLYFISPLILGLLLKATFDGFVEERDFVYLAILIGAYTFVEFVRRLIVHKGAMVWIRFWVLMEMLLRGGMLRAQVSSGGPHAGKPVAHAGAAMTRFRDDPRDIAMYTDGWIDVFGATVFAAAAVAVMASIDAWLTVIVLLPVAAIALTTRFLGRWVASAHRRNLEQTSRLTACLRDVFAAHGTIRLYGAREGASAEVGRRASERSRAAVVDRVITESIRAASVSLSGVAVGVMLLVVADDMRSGAFSVGDLALFTSYLGYMTFLPRMTGHVLTRHRQAGVAFGRMGELAADADPANLLVDLDLSIDTDNREPRPAPTSPRSPLEQLVVNDLRHVFADGAGLHEANLTLERGTLTVITGHVGAGKTTLIRALLGLVPAPVQRHPRREHFAGSVGPASGRNARHRRTHAGGGCHGGRDGHDGRASWSPTQWRATPATGTGARRSQTARTARSRRSFQRCRRRHRGASVESTPGLRGDDPGRVQPPHSHRHSRAGAHNGPRLPHLEQPSP